MKINVVKVYQWVRRFVQDMCNEICYANNLKKKQEYIKEIC